MSTDTAVKPAPKDRIAFNLDPALSEQIRDAVVYLSREGLTINSFCVRAVERELARLQKEHMGAAGKPFPKRKAGSLKPGRPIR